PDHRLRPGDPRLAGLLGRARDHRPGRGRSVFAALRPGRQRLPRGPGWAGRGGRRSGRRPRRADRGAPGPQPGGHPSDPVPAPARGAGAADGAAGHRDDRAADAGPGNAPAEAPRRRGELTMAAVGYEERIAAAARDGRAWVALDDDPPRADAPFHRRELHVATGVVVAYGARPAAGGG